MKDNARFKQLKQQFSELSSIRKRQYIVGAGGLVVMGLCAAFLVGRFSGEPLPDFTQYAAGDERKTAFFNYFLPLVVTRNQEIIELREMLADYRQQDSLNGRQIRTLSEIAEEFGVESFDPSSDDAWTTLIDRVDVIPPSLALAQGANESAWGTSRFAREGNNFYGEWCFVAGCGIVPQSREAGATHEVADFRSPRESVYRYMANLNRHSAYDELRRIRAEQRRNNDIIRGLSLAEGLSRYSERGSEYIEEIQQMIRFNQLDELDTSPTQLSGDTRSL